jgi:hypothetical protein
VYCCDSLPQKPAGNFFAQLTATRSKHAAVRKLQIAALERVGDNEGQRGIRDPRTSYVYDSFWMRFWARQSFFSFSFFFTNELRGAAARGVPM